jgi:hypothetical protein
MPKSHLSTDGHTSYCHLGNRGKTVNIAASPDAIDCDWCKEAIKNHGPRLAVEAHQAGNPSLANALITTFGGMEPALVWAEAGVNVAAAALAEARDVMKQLEQMSSDRCPLACPHGARCTLPKDHEGGHNIPGCACNEPLL